MLTTILAFVCRHLKDQNDEWWAVGWDSGATGDKSSLLALPGRNASLSGGVG